MSGPDLVVRLRHPGEMFSLADADFFRPDARLQPGVDEALAELRATRRRRTFRLTVELPADQATTPVACQLPAAVRRYCELKLHENRLHRRTIRRDGFAALGIGAVLFVVGLYYSVTFAGHRNPTILRELLGDGVFLVVAWVGLWYPLDTLLFAGQPLARERRALRALAEAPVEVVGY